MPHSTGQDIVVVNQYGDEVRSHHILSSYVHQLQNSFRVDSQHTNNRSYHLEILWIEDRHIQEQLKIIQCIAVFHGRVHPCRTSVVNINFIHEQGITWIHAWLALSIVMNGLPSLPLFIIRANFKACRYCAWDNYCLWGNYYLLSADTAIATAGSELPMDCTSTHTARTAENTGQSPLKSRCLKMSLSLKSLLVSLLLTLLYYVDSVYCCKDI